MSIESHYLRNELYNKIKEDQDIFDFLQAGSLDGIWYWDLEEPENEWMSPAFWTTLGYDPKKRKHLASEWQDLINPDDLEVALENFKKHCADPKHPYDQIVRYRHRDGSTVWVRCRGLAVRDKTGKPIRMLGAHTDLTSLKKAEEALRESEEHYRSLVENQTDLVSRFTPDGTFVFVNDSYCRFFEKAKDELIGKKWHALPVDEDVPLIQEKLQTLRGSSSLSIPRR